MPKTELAIKTYPALLSQLKTVFIQGLQKIEAEKVKTYWRTGEIISNYILENKERADYGENIFDKLSEDLGVERTLLLRAVKFYRTFPIVAAQQQLTWSHYRKLITIEDKTKREIFAKRAANKGWGYRELSEAIRLDQLKVEEPQEKSEEVEERPHKKLSFLRGKLYTYQVLEPGFIHPIEEKLVIDLGFKVLIHAEIKVRHFVRHQDGETNGETSPKSKIAKKDFGGGIRLKAEEIIESEKSGGVYSFKHSDAAPKELYTYKALVERVVDADTIWLNIDLGFDCWIREKVRLRGIDAPEISTQKGIEAKEFVEARLKEVDFVVIKTHKSDKYDRYLADIFYQKEEGDLKTVLEQGTFLNQELLDRGLAREMKD